MEKEETVERAAPQTDAGGLARIEKMLEDQAEHNEKLLKLARTRTVIVVIALIAFVVIGSVFCIVLAERTAGLPQLIESANTLTDTVQSDLVQAVKSMSKIDFKQMGEAIKLLSAIDFEGINNSIDNLEKGVEAFRAFAEALAKPAQAVGDLFG